MHGAMRVAESIGGGTCGRQLDVADRSSCDQLAKAVEQTLGPIAILVNNAGIIRRGKVEAAKVRTDWDVTMAVNLDGPYNMVTAFLNQLRATGGSVINIGSIQSFVARPNSATYTTSKGEVHALTKAPAIELSLHGVRVNFSQRIPLGRLGEPADLAEPDVFLASDLARYVTGVTLPVNDGFLAY